MFLVYDLLVMLKIIFSGLKRKSGKYNRAISNPKIKPLNKGLYQ